ncbi:MAG TPA: four helix bundle protein [Thermoanaerobaculia bacterium]|nr:four helix bundle protein [Thermoanaerobaculia bacterium]
MSKVSRFEDLIAWQKARLLVKRIYALSQGERFVRDFALRDQIRDAAISIPSNIAEGFERNRPAEFHQFLSVAKASCAELRTHIYLAFDIEYITEEAMTSVLEQAEEVARVIGGLRAAVSRNKTRARLSTQHSALSTQH